MPKGRTVRFRQPGRARGLDLDNSSMGLTAAIAGQASRLPDRLEDLHGPWQGVVVLNVHKTWHELREFDVARFLNAQRLREDWPQLRPLVSARMRRALERKLGLLMS